MLYNKTTSQAQRISHVDIGQRAINMQSTSQAMQSSVRSLDCGAREMPQSETGRLLSQSFECQDGGTGCVVTVFQQLNISPSHSWMAFISSPFPTACSAHKCQFEPSNGILALCGRIRLDLLVAFAGVVTGIIITHQLGALAKQAFYPN